MALTIIGTYPIVNRQISSINDDGVETLSYVFTVKTVDAYKYIPNKDDEYYGPNNEQQPSSSTFNETLYAQRSKYLVTTVNIENLNGGLTQIAVNTAGTKNAETPPKVELLPNYPLLFGLAGISQSQAIDPNYQWTYIGAGKPRSGYGVMLTFITKNTVEAETGIFSTLSNNQMPGVFRGARLPTPNTAPFYFNGASSVNEGDGHSFVQSNYRGFICAETTYQKIGGVIVFKLIYKEMGEAYNVNCPPGGGVCETQTIYRFD